MHVRIPDANPHRPIVKLLNDSGHRQTKAHTHTHTVVDSDTCSHQTVMFVYGKCCACTKFWAIKTLAFAPGVSANATAAVAPSSHTHTHTCALSRHRLDDFGRVYHPYALRTPHSRRARRLRHTRARDLRTFIIIIENQSAIASERSRHTVRVELIECLTRGTHRLHIGI